MSEIIQYEWKDLWEQAAPYIDYIYKQIDMAFLYHKFPRSVEEVFRNIAFKKCIYPIRLVGQKDPKTIKGYLRNNIWGFAANDTFKYLKNPARQTLAYDENPGDDDMNVAYNPPYFDGERVIICQDQMRLMNKIYDGLEEDEKVLFKEKWIHKTTYRVLAEITGHAVGAVWNHVNNLAIKLRETFYEIDCQTKGDQIFEAV